MSDSNSYDDQVESEYLEETADLINDLDVVVQQFATGQEEGRRRFDILLGKLGSLCVTGRHTRHALLNVTMHRLQNYMDGLTRPTDAQVQDVLTFSDTIRAILEGAIEHEGWDFSEFVRSLPVLRPLEIEDLEHLDVEIMLVEGRRSAARLFERELRACGYRVASVRNPLEALALAVKTKPDMVLASAELDDISGIDLACALSAMPATRAIPFALLTSYRQGDPRLKDLPEKAGILNKGAGFSDDLADVLTKFGIA